MIEPAMEEAAQADVFVIIGTSLNVYLLRDQEAPTSPQGYALPDRYEGYQLYQGLVRGDSIWIEM